jgi:predicted TPR repeat methyltransferase
MTSSEPAAHRLLARAYALQDARQSLALYRDWATTYDRTMLGGLGYVSPLRTARMLAAVLPLRQARVLDVGCGTGLAAIELAKRQWLRLDGLDVSPQMLDVAQKRGVYERLCLADLNRPLPFPSLRYDALICTGTFTHGHVGAGCLTELLRVLRPGGHFAFTVHRDVLHSMGFAAAIGRFAETRKIAILQRQEGGYYAASTTPEGYYFLVRKRG